MSISSVLRGFAPSREPVVLAPCHRIRSPAGQASPSDSAAQARPTGSGHERQQEAGRGYPTVRKDSDAGDNLEVCQNVSVRFLHLCVFLLVTTDFNSPATIINRRAAEFAEPRNLAGKTHRRHMNRIQAPIHIESCVGLTQGFLGLKHAWIGNICLNLPRHNLRMSIDGLSNAILLGAILPSLLSPETLARSIPRALIRPMVYPATWAPWHNRGRHPQGYRAGRASASWSPQDRRA